jgi:hypothetical protein
MSESPCPYALEVPVTAEEWRVFMFGADLYGESVADHLRRQLGLVPERHIAAVREQCERELSRPRLRRMRR